MDKYCPNCGFIVNEQDEKCSYCETPLKEVNKFVKSPFKTSKKEGLILLLLVLFLPGAHYLYVNKVERAILFFVTFGGFGIWWFIDVVNVIMGRFEDEEGHPIKL